MQFDTPSNRAWIVAHLLVIKKNKILLGLRTNTEFADGMYGLPAGRIEIGESALAGMIREAKEELNIELQESDLELVSVMHHLWSDKSHTQFNLFFLCKKDCDGEITNNEPEKCAALKFFHLTRLPKDIIPFMAEGIHNYINKIQYSEYGWK